jgi:hypothetical protein
MFRTLFLCLTLLFATTAIGQAPAAKPTRVLFVGNSITYVNNLPAMFVALAASQGKPVEATMLVRGGETLSGHLASGLLTSKLVSGFDELVLQERGGDLICAGYNAAVVESCRKSHEAHVQLRKMARDGGVETILLGTFQIGPASKAIEEKEAELALELDVAHVPISEDLRRGREERPSAEWLNADGMHPGDELTMLMAIKLYAVVFGELPQAREVLVRGERYNDGHAQFSGKELLVEPRGDATRSFSRERMAVLLAEAARPVQ